MQIENNVIVGFDKTDKHLFIPKTIVGADYAIADLHIVEGFDSITVEEGNTHFYVQDGCLIWRDKKALMLALQGAKIPDDGSVTTIAGGAFMYRNEMKEIEIPASIEKINHQAFGCTELEKVTLNEGLKELDAYAFGFNDFLKELAIPKSVKNIVMHDEIKDLDEITKRGYKDKVYYVYPYSFVDRWVRENKLTRFYRENSGKHVCPVCGKTVFSSFESYDICPICGWEDETWCEMYPDEESTANYRSLNDYRKRYQESFLSEFEKWSIFIHDLAENHLTLTEKEFERVNAELEKIKNEKKASVFQKMYEAWHSLKLNGVSTFLTGDAEEWFVFYLLDMTQKNPMENE